MISVIIPTYNRKHEMIHAVKSVLAQTALDKIQEIIIVDDGSTDSTADHITDFFRVMNITSPCLVLLKQSNQGAAHARNKGMDEASGDFIAFLDSDDQWLSNKIEEQMAIFKSKPDIDLLGCDAVGLKYSLPYRRWNDIYKLSIFDMWIKSIPGMPSVIMRRKVFQDFGGFDVDIKRYEDCHYWQRLRLSGCNMYHYNNELVYLSRKKPFGESGLSENLDLIYNDIILSICILYKDGMISTPVYLLLKFYNSLKHYRRKIIVYFRS